MFVTAVLDVLIPDYCRGCKQFGVYYCEECRAQYKQYTPSVFIDEQRAILRIFPYTDQIAQLIHLGKYSYEMRAWEVLFRELHRYDQYIDNFFEGVDAIVSIPLHPRKYAERGYNQAELIAKQLSDNIPLVRGLRRIRYTKAQMSLGKKDRLKNMNNVFAISKEGTALVGKSVVIVDDVYTSGATMHAAIDCFARAGVHDIRICVLASGAVE